MTVVVGIVAEGSTDIAVLGEYLSAWVTRHGASIRVEVRPVQPAIDATSGEFGSGGWTLVKTWCEEHSPGLRALDLFAPVFDGEQPLDFLIVQLDGDVIDEYTAFYPDITVPDKADAHERGIIIEQVLERWLWGSSEQRAVDPIGTRHCLVASIRALEAWLVAGLDPSISDPEEIEDPEKELMRLKPELETKVVAGAIRLKKLAPTWRALAQRTCGALPHIVATCAHCGRFLTYVDALLEQLEIQTN